MKQVTRSLGINHYNVYSDVKASVAEAANRTLRQLLYRYAYHTNKSHWVSYLPYAVDTINHSKSRSTGFRPVDVGSKEDTIIWHRQNKPNEEKPAAAPQQFQVNELVRISQIRHPFEKGSTAGYTKEIFKVAGVQYIDNLWVYYLKDLRGEEIRGYFTGAELVKVLLPEYEAERYKR